MSKKVAKRKLVELLLEQGLARDAKHAQGLILSGEVLVDDKPVTQVGALVATCRDDWPVAHHIRLRSEPQKYVSRGGLKLEAALQHFHISVDQKICLDLGASTGGFTDCLLQQGAAKVYAVDVGYGQLAERVRQDARVIVLDRTHARDLNAQLIPELVDLAVMDVSFIAAHTLFAFIHPLLAKQALVVVLVKPQFELPARFIPPGGIVADEASHQQACELVLQAAEQLGWKKNGLIPSPILGTKGNREFLAVFATSPL